MEWAIGIEPTMVSLNGAHITSIEALIGFRHDAPVDENEDEVFSVLTPIRSA